MTSSRALGARSALSWLRCQGIGLSRPRMNRNRRCDCSKPAHQGLSFEMLPDRSERFRVDVVVHRHRGHRRRALQGGRSSRANDPQHLGTVGLGSFASLEPRVQLLERAVASEVSRDVRFAPSSASPPSGTAPSGSITTAPRVSGSGDGECIASEHPRNDPPPRPARSRGHRVRQARQQHDPRPRPSHSRVSAAAHAAGSGSCGSVQIAPRRDLRCNRKAPGHRAGRVPGGRRHPANRRSHRRRPGQ